MASLLRNLVFTAFGSLYFSASAFEAAAKRFSATALDVDLGGKVMVVTGGNAGLGKEVATQFAKRGGTVYLLCRSKERGLAAQEEIRSVTKNPNVFMYEADVSRPKTLVEFARKFSKETRGKVDVLVNNAGILPSKKVLTSDGFEETFATNTLGTYIMTKLMLPLMSKDKPRVVNVSSGGMYTQKLCPEDPQMDALPFDGMVAYSQTKRQQVVMTEWFAKKYPDVFFASCHPGWAETPGVKSSIPEFYSAFSSLFRTPQQGADTIVWLGISPEVDTLLSGSFFHDRQVARKHLPLCGTQETPEEAQKFMDKLERICQPFIE